MRNVTIVVPVFIINCHVSDHPNNGPETAQAAITVSAATNAAGLPAAAATAWAKPLNPSFMRP
jgi:hypothetical protein